VAAEIHVALSLVTDHATARGVKLTVGIQPELFLQADPLVFREVISNVLAGAIDAASGGRVLITAIRREGRIEIMVTDEAALADLAPRETELRQSRQLIAVHGGSLAVKSLSGIGTEVVLTLAAASN
jgi:signal transduction histidine kinase